MIPKKVHSYRSERAIKGSIETHTMIFTDCSECDRGGNGNAKEPCSSGWQQRTPGLGCYIGTPKTEILAAIMLTKKDA